MFYPGVLDGVGGVSRHQVRKWKVDGRGQEGQRGWQIHPALSRVVWEDGQALQTSSLPCRKSPLCVCGLPHRLQDPTCSPSQIGTQREQLADSPTRGWDQGRAEKEVKLMQVKERSLHPFLQPPSRGGHRQWGRKVCVSCC